MPDRLPLSALSDSEVEQRLIDLGPRLYPTTPDLATQMRHRLESEPVGTSLTPLPATRLAGTRPRGAGRREKGRQVRKPPLPSSRERGLG